MDQVQDLIDAADEIFQSDDEVVYIAIAALGRDGTHPKPLDGCYFHRGCSDARTGALNHMLVRNLGGWGRHIALRCSLLINDTGSKTQGRTVAPHLGLATLTSV